MKTVFKIVVSIIFLSSSLNVFSQSIEVTGTVVDENNSPIPGATVLSVENPAVGTTTDFDGNYALTVPANGSIQFSYIGYQSQTIPVNNQTNINVALSPSTSEWMKLSL